MLTTPRSTENQSLALGSPPQHDQFAENSVEPFLHIPGVYPTLDGNAQIPPSGDENILADWSWLALEDILQNGSLQAEPWNGAGFSDLPQAMQSEDYSNILDDDPQLDFLDTTLQGDFPIEIYMTSGIGQATTDNAFAPHQLIPSSSYSVSTKPTQVMQTSFQPPNWNAHSDRIQLGYQQDIPPAAPLQLNNTIVESDLIPSSTGLGLPKAKKLARRTKVQASPGSRAVTPARVEKPTHRGKKPRRSYDPDERAATACTRELGVCARCKFQKNRVSPTKGLRKHMT